MRAGGARPSRRRQVAGGGGGSPPGTAADPEHGARPGRRRRIPPRCGGSRQGRGATGGGGSPREARRTEPHRRCRGGRRVDGAADAGSRREAWREGDGSERRCCTEFVDDELKAPRGATAPPRQHKVGHGRRRETATATTAARIGSSADSMRVTRYADLLLLDTLRAAD